MGGRRGTITGLCQSHKECLSRCEQCVTYRTTREARWFRARVVLRCVCVCELIVSERSVLVESYGDVQQRFGLLLLHLVSVQRNVFDLPALGEQQVCSWSHGVNIRPRSRTHRRRGGRCLVDACEWELERRSCVLQFV